ncbi:GtrA family protein [Paenibacillus sp. J22TS3]|uniref:GtrA family protein n=1 Tax=Paenibacillus sp. J22TS3 TaxID=2807192 RepID=UPI001B2D4BCC|nr:GtrA family protein [Paenibacillus sp. J22TS3]GIP20982.1 hypothetical protein J22TS3_12570 [Paenibacillus sp. J22TS3]
MRGNLKQWIQFGIVGLLNTGIDLGTFTLLIAGGFPAIPAQIISYSCGVLNSYVLNSRWTFREESGRKQQEIPRFILINLAALAVSSLLLKLMYGRSGISLILCKLAATAASLLINYAGSRYFVFTRQIKREKE